MKNSIKERAKKVPLWIKLKVRWHQFLLYTGVIYPTYDQHFEVCQNVSFLKFPELTEDALGNERLYGEISSFDKRIGYYEIWVDGFRNNYTRQFRMDVAQEHLRKEDQC